MRFGSNFYRRMPRILPGYSQHCGCFQQQTLNRHFNMGIETSNKGRTCLGTSVICRTLLYLSSESGTSRKPPLHSVDVETSNKTIRWGLSQARTTGAGLRADAQRSGILSTGKENWGPGGKTDFALCLWISHSKFV